MYTDKLPPHDIESEESVLGSILLDEQALGKVTGFLQPEHFYRDRHRYAFEAALQLADSNTAINQVTLAFKLDANGKLDECGGPAWLAHLVAIIPTPLHVAHYGQIVYRTAQHRKAIELAAKVVASAYDSKLDSEAIEGLLAVQERAEPQTSGFRSYREVADETWNDFDAWLEEGVKPTGILTGLTPLDRTLNGLGAGRMYVLAGRPGMGKSDLARDIAERVSKQGKVVAYVSLEMPRADIFQRSIFARAGVDRYALPLGASEAQKTKLRDAMGELDGLPMAILDTPKLQVREIRAHAQALKARLGGLDLLVVDHLGHVGDMAGKDLYDRTTEISGRLMALAKVLDIPILVLVQLNRQCELRPGDHRPRLADLRDSGAIEQDAYAVTFLWRYQYYHEREDPGCKEPPTAQEKVTLHLLTAKNRGGPCGEDRVYYDVTTGRIGAMEADHEQL